MERILHEIMSKCAFPFRVNVFGHPAVCEGVCLKRFDNGHFRLMAMVVPENRLRREVMQVDARDVWVSPSQHGTEAMRHYQTNWAQML
jgi:hypothetical protein